MTAETLGRRLIVLAVMLLAGQQLASVTSAWHAKSQNDGRLRHAAQANAAASLPQMISQDHSRPSAASCRGAPNFCRGDDRGDGVGVGVGGLHCSTRPQDAAAIAVVSHYSYNVSWLEEQPFCFEVMERVHGAGEAQPQHPQVSINKAMETVAYLRYIIDHYDELPRHVIFLHDHRTAWHQLDMVELLHAVRLEAYPFFSLNGIWNRGLQPENYAHVARFWHENDLDRDIGPLPSDNNAIEFMCCAQFVVSRARIRQRPLALWRRLYAWVERTELGDALSGRIFEWLWHVLMGEPFRSERPDPLRVCGNVNVCFNRNSRMPFPFPVNIPDSIDMSTN